MADKEATSPARAPLSPRLRFEVFKRDRFTCQYCGHKAPDVLLHIDHLIPVAGGGTNDLLNLVTSCRDCNLGKGARLLDDHHLLDRARTQLEELEARREQLEMLLDWHRSLGTFEEDKLSRIADFWSSLTPGFSLSDNGRASLRKWLKRFSVDELLAAMRTAADHYLEFTTDGTCTQESVELAFNKVSGICRVTRSAAEDPDLKELLYIKGILRNRCGYFNPGQAMQWLRAARSWGVPMSRLEQMARTVNNWTHFGHSLDDLLSEYRDDTEESSE
jgi:hypothetical protein